MKKYNSINYYGEFYDIPVIAFDKLDGSNFRAEYSKKKGFYKFGTRNTMINEQSENFGQCINIFLNKYADDLDKVFRSKEYNKDLSFVCFGEYFGDNSEYGQHQENDNFDVVLFDVNVYKKGFVKPKQFVENFGHLHIPKIVYRGNLDESFINDVKNNKFDLKEGVIAKGVVGTKKSEQVYYCKIKTNKWLENLKIRCGEKALQEELKRH